MSCGPPLDSLAGQWFWAHLGQIMAVPHSSPLKKFVREIHRRSLWQVLGIYVLGSWVVLQVVGVLETIATMPEWFAGLPLGLLILGLPIVLATAFVQEGGPKVERESSTDVSTKTSASGESDPPLAPSDAKANSRLFTWRNAFLGGVGAFAVIGVIAVFSAFFGGAGGGTDGPPPLFGDEASPSIAVLPFLVSGNGLEEWEDGLADLVSTGLDGAAGLRSVDTRTVLSYWDRTVGGSANPDLPLMLAAAQATGARFAVEGSVTSIGSLVRLSTRVHDLETSARLGTTAQVEGFLENPHDLVDRLSLEILRILLGGEAEDLPRVDLAAVTSNSTPALRAYLRGERAYRQGSFEEAADAYQEAVAIDSTFALAHFRLDLAAGWGGAPSAVLNQARARSRALADRLPERERLLVTGYLQWTRSATDPAVLTSPVQRAAELYPNDAEVVYILAETYLHSRSVVKSAWEVDELFQRAVELDSGFAPYRIHPVDLAFNLHGDSALAAERVAEYASIVNDPTDPRVEANDRGFRLVFGDELARAAMHDSLVQGLDRDVWNVYPQFLLGHSRSLSADEAFLNVPIVQRLAAPGSLDEAQVRRDLGRNLANQGRISEALAVLELPELAGFGQRTCLIAEYRFLGIAVPDEMVREAAANAGNPNGAFQDAFCGALLAAELGLRPDFDAGRTRLETFASTSAAARDEIPHLDVFWEWKQGATGRPELARSLAGVGDTNAAPYWAFWLGELHREAGNLREAERAYLTTQLTAYSRGNYTLSWWHLAGIYRELGDPAKERDALGRVIAAWENADAELQPRVEEARARLAALN